MFLLSDLLANTVVLLSNHLHKRLINLQAWRFFLWALESVIIVYGAHMTATQKLIFIASFMWMMNWGVRVTQVILNAFS